MKVKQCGNCKWWDRDNFNSTHGSVSSTCSYIIENLSGMPEDWFYNNKFITEFDQGEECPVYLERQLPPSGDN